MGLSEWLSSVCFILKLADILLTKNFTANLTHLVVSTNLCTLTWTGSYCPTLIFDVMGNGLACAVLVSACLHGGSLNVYTKPQNFRPSRDTIGI